MSTDTPIIGVIPYLGRVCGNLTRGLVDELRYQGDYSLLLLYNNGPPGDTIHHHPPTGIITIQAEGWPLARMWNDAWHAAQALVDPHGKGIPFDICYLNNDITISPEFLAKLSSRLRQKDTLWAVSPNQDHLPGSGIRYEPRGDEHALYGSAFMVQGERFVGVERLFDEDYLVWYHESDLANKILLSGGRVGIALDVPFTHIDGGSLTTKEAGYTNLARGVENPTEIDTKRFYENYGQIAWPDKVIPYGRTLH